MEEVVVLGRRGAAQVSFSLPELRELCSLNGVAVSVEWGKCAHSAPAPADAFQLSRVRHAVHKHASGIHPFELVL